MISQNRTDWYAESKYGVMVHWTTASLKEDGSQYSDYQTAVNAFDVQKFAYQLHEAGASFIQFTITHEKFYLAFPCKTLDALLPGRTCTRDLYSELFEAIQPYGIRMLFYLNWDGFRDPEYKLATRYEEPTENIRIVNSIVREIGERYGRRLSGWWVDGMYSGVPSYEECRFDLEEYADSLRVGNSDRIIAFNFKGTDKWDCVKGAGITDFQAGELTDLSRLPSGRFSGEGRIQWSQLTNMDNRDWAYERIEDAPQPRFTDNEVITHIRKVISLGGVFQYNAAPYQDTLISNATMSQLKAIKVAIYS